ncbi:MAG: pectinesterase family protein [Lachnospiraceae bacterium]|nr:pectinesterase family protein [Lachnospiraceae bacterium]
MITVAKNGTGDFTTIMDAINSISGSNEPETIVIHEGIYNEVVEIRRSNLTIYGDNPSNTYCTYNNYANMIMEDGVKRGTFRSYSFLVLGDNININNLTIANTSGTGKVYGQAVSVYAEGDMITFNNCRMLGYQDTLFTGPLPKQEIKKGGFTGPTEYFDRINGRQLYTNCYIEGDVDFIFGSATAFFKNCEICSLNRDEECNGYATAPSQPEGQKYGYVFEDCRFTTKGCAKGTVYLARPWRDYGQTVLIRCEIGEHINEAGFHDWNKELARKVCNFAEYKCYGAGSDRSKRAVFSRELSDEEAAEYSFVKVFAQR